ncbi:MAG: penicillin acylase family protein [Acidobacteriia bacterium]|nr:penicillin acylase family protein [Terriglobia bacterium]
MNQTPPSRLQVDSQISRILRKSLLTVVAAILGLLVAAVAWAYWRAHACLPQLEGTIQLPGLSARVEILRDARGVPHLRAQSFDDLLFAQGYVTAQDRLWQMDLSRRLAQGELAEILGERALRLDVENRTLGLRQMCERAIAEFDPESRQMLTSYVRGVNAFISTHRNLLPIEFLILRYQPRPWREVDSFAVAANMWKVLSTSWPQDLIRERIRARVAPDLYANLFPDHSPLDHPVAELGAGTGQTSQFLRAPPGPANPDPRLNALLTIASPQALSTGQGSNGWVVAGRHTVSGKPLLANDPHLRHSVPSVWYMIGLKAPGVDVLGATFPGLPAVILGHNERIAWGATNTGPDVQDLYVETFNPHEPSQYLHNGRWSEAESREEIIRVRGRADYRLKVRVTRHGPVISREGNRDLALRWTALEPHAMAYPFWKIDRARNWEEFVAALRDLAGPMQNFVYADADGNIGYYAAGWVPVRRRGDGSVPVDGSTDDDDWTGYIPFEKLPHSFNPSSGMLATANGRIVPDGYPYFLTHAWDPPYRTARIYQLLEAGGKFAVGDMLRIQFDIHAIYFAWLAKQLLSAAEQYPPQGSDAQFALAALQGWDGEARADSAAPLICEVTNRALYERILKPKLGNDLSDYSWPLSSVFIQNVIENRWNRWLPPGDRDFNVTLVKSLEEGVRLIPQMAGSSDYATWRWGDTIRLTFRHPLDSLPLLGRLLDIGPFPQSGTHTTVKDTTPSGGVSMRMVVDFGHLDYSVQNITLGESGQVFSPYYRDQFEAWYEGSSFPMAFSDAAVQQATRHRLVLEPAVAH